MIYNIFYTDSTKAISWVTNADCDSAMISDQADAGLSHFTLDITDFDICDNHYVNDAGNGVVEYSTFSPNVSAASIAIDGTSTVSNIPEGTTIKVQLSNTTVTTITMNSDESLTLTGTMAGKYSLIFNKAKYYEATTTITVQAQS